MYNRSYTYVCGELNRIYHRCSRSAIIIIFTIVKLKYMVNNMLDM